MKKEVKITAVIKKPLSHLKGQKGVYVKENGSEGRTFITCEVDSNGRVLKPSYLNGIDPDYYTLTLIVPRKRGVGTVVLRETIEGLQEVKPVFHSYQGDFDKYVFPHGLIITVWGNGGHVEITYVNLSFEDGCYYLREMPILDTFLPLSDPDRALRSLEMRYRTYFPAITEAYKRALEGIFPTKSPDNKVKPQKEQSGSSLTQQPSKTTQSSKSNLSPKQVSSNKKGA